MNEQRADDEPGRSGSYGRIARGAGIRSTAAEHPAVSGTAATESAVRAVRRRWASGLVVVTTVVPEGFRGATVSAFAPVSLEPPLVLVCLDRSGRMADAVPEAGRFAISILDRSQEWLADRFAGRGPLPDARLTGVAYQLAPSGCPVLDGVLGWFDCRVDGIHDAGDHRVVIGAVETVGGGEDTDDPLVNYDGRYRGLESA